MSSNYALRIPLNIANHPSTQGGPSPYWIRRWLFSAAEINFFT